MCIVMGESVTVVSAGFSKSGRKKKQIWVWRPADKWYEGIANGKTLLVDSLLERAIVVRLSQMSQCLSSGESQGPGP